MNKSKCTTQRMGACNCICTSHDSSMHTRTLCLYHCYHLANPSVILQFSQTLQVDSSETVLHGTLNRGSAASSADTCATRHMCQKKDCSACLRLRATPDALHSRHQSKFRRHLSCHEIEAMAFPETTPTAAPAARMESAAPCLSTTDRSEINSPHFTCRHRC